MADVTDLGIDGLSRFREVGSGGFATVYAAWDEGFQRWVAVKVLPSLDDDGRRRFDRERALMGQLDSHPNVVTPYRSGYTSSGDAFLVMEYLDGGSLEELLRRRGSLRVDEAVDYLLPITEAVEAGHRLSILHRDIKPANILLTVDGVPKLTDFGISATRDATTTAAAFTLAHAPPESFADGYDRQDERSDLYSLVSTLYTLIRGRPPFEVSGQDSARAQLMRILTHPPAMIGRADVDAFFASGLAKDPADRPQSAGELSTALTLLASGPHRSQSADAAELVQLADTVSESPSITTVEPTSLVPIPPRPASSANIHYQRQDDLSGRPASPAPQPRRRPVALLLAAGAALTAVVIAVSLAPSQPGPSVSDAEAAFAGGADTTDLSSRSADTALETTGPGPGSFSIGQLKLGLLTNDELPEGWTIDDDATRSESGMDLPCNDRFEWSFDSSSDQAFGGYRAASGIPEVTHTVWAMDDWVAEDLFDQMARATDGCKEPWGQSLAADGGLGLEMAVIPSPSITSRGHDTVVSSVSSSAADGARQVTILSRCGGLISRLVLSSPSDDGGTISDELADQLAARAYDRLVGAAEWENATCPPS